MFDHVEFEVGSIEASRLFYRAVIEALGLEEIALDDGAGVAAFGHGPAVAAGTASPLLRLTEGAPVTPRMHLCLRAPSKEAVAAAHAAGLLHGGRDNGAPGYRDAYMPGYYAAFMYDPDGHNLEFLYREPR